MNKSESIAAIAPALHKAQGAIRAAIKDATNPHFRSKYADLSSVIEAVKAALQSNGITFLQGIEDADNGVAVETMLLHTSGEWLSSTLKIPASKQDAQGYGSAITYGRRYGLQSMCGVPAEDDDGNAAAASAPPARPISVAGQAWELLPEEDKKFLQGIADQVRAIGEKEGWLAGMRFLEEQKLDADEKVALWSRFDSKERAAMEPHKRKKAA